MDDIIDAEIHISVMSSSNKAKMFWKNITERRFLLGRRESYVWAHVAV
jgi:hypothetical protein